MRFPVLLAVAVALGSGCTHPSASPSFASSFETIDPPPAPPPAKHGGGERAPPRDDIVVPAQILMRDVVNPVYPVRAIGVLGAPRVAVVTVTVDADGTVSDVEPSIRSPLLLDDVGSAVFAAIRTAVMRWHVMPPRVIHYRQAGNGDRVYVGSEALAGTLEIKFTFDASGKAVR